MLMKKGSPFLLHVNEIIRIVEAGLTTVKKPYWKTDEKKQGV
jgi:hypothetical protein